MSPGEAVIADAAARLAILSRRELQALECAANGLSTPATAQLLGCADSTVQSFRAGAMRKLEVGSMCEAVVILATARVAALLRPAPEAPRPGQPRPEGLAHPMRRANPNAPRFEYQGRNLTVQELADLAGCHRETFRQRLRFHSVEDSVAMGKADVRRKRPDAVRKAPAQRVSTVPPGARPIRSGHVHSAGGVTRHTMGD